MCQHPNIQMKLSLWVFKCLQRFVGFAVAAAAAAAVDGVDVIVMHLPSSMGYVRQHPLLKSKLSFLSLTGDEYCQLKSHQVCLGPLEQRSLDSVDF